MKQLLVKHQHFNNIMSLDERFSRAVWLIRNGPPKDSSNETKLAFYKYYKQATEGDVTGAQVCSQEQKATSLVDST